MKKKLPPLQYNERQHARASSIMEVRKTSDEIEYGSAAGAKSRRDEVDPFYEKDVQIYVKDMSKPVSAASPTRASENDISNVRSVQIQNRKQKDHSEVLSHIHAMRVNCFEQRADPDAPNEKPYLPMISADEKELIMEQYYASKRKLSKT